jgi:hypothetical protein
MERGHLLMVVGLTAAMAGGCVVGEGSGSAQGPLWMLGCFEGDDDGTEANPIMYDLAPTYFVGEPIEDISDGPPSNRLIIRMQRNGNALEITDTVYFDIPNSRDVAACLRGQTINGVPNGWDNVSTGTVDTLDPAWCQPPVPPPDGSGFPRIRLFPFGPVRSSFTPFNTCESSAHPPHITSITGVAADGWIDFLDFGSAEENGLAPDERHDLDKDFKVDFGQRLYANFHIVMGDDRVVTAERLMVEPPPAPTIGGTLDGYFDFDLQRGQGAQTFP